MRKAKSAEIDWTDVYANFDTYSSEKRMIRDGDDDDCPENVWVKRISPELVVIDNDPLSGRYRLHDAIDRKGEVVHRRFNERMNFSYLAKEGEEEDKELRGQIYERLKNYGLPSFFMKGCGYLLIEAKLSDQEKTEMAEKVYQVLRDLDAMAEVPNE